MNVFFIKTSSFLNYLYSDKEDLGGTASTPILLTAAINKYQFSHFIICMYAFNLSTPNTILVLQPGNNDSNWTK